MRVLEQAQSSEREGLAAGIGLAAYVKKFFEIEDRLGEPLGVPNDAGFEILDENLQVKRRIMHVMNMTTWDAAYYRARANFDGLKSAYCPNPPPVNPDGNEGQAVYETGKSVTKVDDVDGRMTVFVRDTINGVDEEYTSDLVIAADGANSSIRRQLNPTLKREEPGYVIWRGTIPTKDLSQEVRDKIENKPVIFPGKQTYCVM